MSEYPFIHLRTHSSYSLTESTIKIEKLVENAVKKKIPMIALFPSTPESKKNNKGSEALNKKNLVCRALK